MAKDAQEIAETILKDPGEAPMLLKRCVVGVMNRHILRGKSLREKFTGAVDI